MCRDNSRRDRKERRDLAIRQARLLERLLVQARHGHGEIEHFQDRRPLRAAITAVATADVVRDDATLTVGGSGHGDVYGQPRDHVCRFHGITTRVDVGIGGAHVVVYRDAAAWAECEAGGLGEIGVGLRTQREDDKIGLDGFAAFQLHGDASATILETIHAAVGEHAHTLTRQFGLQQLRHLRIERPHQLGHLLYYGHLQPAKAEILGRLDADVTAHDHGLFGTRGEARDNPVHIRHVAQFKDGWMAQPRQRRSQRLGTRRQHQLVVRLLVDTMGARFSDSDRFRHRINRRDRGKNAHVDMEGCFERFRCLYQQTGSFLDHAADMVRQSAIGERDVFIFLEHDDLGMLVQTTQPRGARHSGGHTAHNYDFHRGSPLTGLAVKSFFPKKFADACS
jgi:hypothetical protein